MGNGVVLLCKLTHSFVIAITGNEFCLCHWKVGTEREGQVVAVVEFNTGNKFSLSLESGNGEGKKDRWWSW